jgi:hypothetical protein
VSLESAYEIGMARGAHRQVGARTGRRPVTAVWLFLRAEFRRRWRAWLSLALIVGVFAGGVMTAAAGAVRTGSAYARLLDWSRAPDSVVMADPYLDSFARLPPTAVMRVPQATDAAVIKTFNVSPGIIQTPGGLHRLVPAKAAMVPPGDVLVRFRAGVSPQAGRHALAAQLARLGSFTVDGRLLPQTWSTSARCRTCRRHSAPGSRRWPC